MIIAARCLLYGLFHGADYSGNAGWALAGAMVLGVPSASLLAAGIGLWIFLRNRFTT